MTLILSADVWFENLMLSIRTPFWVHVFNLVTFFGNTLTVIGIAGLIGAYMFFFKKEYRPYVAGLVTTLGGAAVCAYLLKEVVQRARPGGLIPAVTETSYSFPSGHATAAMALYGFFAFLLCRLYPEYKKGIVTIATLIVLAIGFSRLYLGVHYPSDVLAGFAVGGLWLWLGVWLTNKLQLRSTVS